MQLVDGLRLAVADLVAGVRLAPLWWRVGIEQTITRYRRTVLGPFWLASSTLSAAFAIAIVFGAIFKTDQHSNLPYIVSGIVCWSVTGAALVDGSSVFFGASGLMQAQKMPLSFHVFLQVDKLFINFLHQIVALWAVLLVLRLFPVPHWQILLSLPLVALTAVMLYIPIGMISLRYRDINYMVGFVGQSLFMLTPVFWRREQLSPNLQWMVTYNPFAHLLELLRQPLLGHPAMANDWAASIIFFSICALAALFSLTFFRRRVVFWL
jgi:ABC-type polysaccharide/polyol phosphate export permease